MTASDRAAFDRNFEFVKNPLRELLTRHPKVWALWIGGQWDASYCENPEYAARREALLRKLRPGIILNDRIGAGRVSNSDYDAEGRLFGDYRAGFGRLLPDASSVPLYDWEAGMAAYVDGDPYNLWPGWPSGFLTDWPWSNLPYTLAYSDSYVWVWAAHTHYSATKNSLNPFLASIANRTFNTGAEPVASFIEDFQTDPLRRGWHFDFDMLNIGRRLDQGPLFPFLPPMSLDSVAYAWSAEEKGVKVRGNWTRGEFGETAGLAAPQRRRCVRPVTPLTASDPIQFAMDFTVESFGNDPANPILLGLYHSAAATSAQSLALQIATANDARIVVAGDGTPWSMVLPLDTPLPAGARLRCRVEFRPDTRALQASLSLAGSGVVLSQATAAVPLKTGPFVLDEAGIAQTETAIATAPADAHRFRLERFVHGVTRVVLSLPPADPGPTRPLLVEGLRPGVTYTVQTSIDLAQWEPTGSLTAGTETHATVEVIATGDQRFYRIGP